MAVDATPIDIFQSTLDWSQTSGLKVWLADETHSTNSVAKDDESPATKPVLIRGSTLFEGPSLYLARKQTKGRGRGDHSWSTPRGSALLSSWSFAMANVPQPIFSALVGLALFESCQTTWPKAAFNIKAPNDLFIGDKKTAGILIETVDQGFEKRTVVGLGLNVGEKPADISTSTCLSEHLSVDSDSWKSFLDTWIVKLKSAVLAGQKNKLEAEVANRLCVALNLHPLLKEPILKVDELAQLHSASRIIHWHEL